MIKFYIVLMSLHLKIKRSFKTTKKVVLMMTSTFPELIYHKT